jgi:CheY-like chemotaxis protein
MNDREFKGTILYVEDDETTYVPHKLIFEREGNYVVHHVDNAGDAIRDINEGLKYDVALIDQGVPSDDGGRMIGHDGFDVISKSKNVNPETPVIFLTGAGEHRPKESCKMFIKPEPIGTIMAEIDKAVKRSRR